MELTRGQSSIHQRPKPVGLCTDMPLSRRVQLAVLAHIRHNHTRYDELLKETSWQNARKVVEALCLDILVKWRGDEETGRDQLDEILREVVVISDSDSEESEDESEDTADSSNDAMDVSDMERDRPAHTTAQGTPRDQRPPIHRQPQVHAGPVVVRTGRGPDHAHEHRPTVRKERRGFKRYRAWAEAIRRNRGDELRPPGPEVVGSVSHGSQQHFGSTIPGPGPGPRPVAMAGGAGILPESHGFVPRPHQPGFSSVVPLPNPPARPMYEQAMPSVHDQMRTTKPLSRHVTPVADRLQDMLVPSIEPMSPDSTVQPTFVRTLPPRFPPSPTRRPVPLRPDSASPSLESGATTKPYYGERRVVDDRPAQVPPQRHHGNPYGRQPAPGYYEPRPVFHSPLPSNVEPRAQPFGTASAPAQRITGGMGRPGDRSNPIIMEDRGGFFERVYDEPRSAFPRRSHADPAPARWAPPAASRVPEPHRVVTWEEGSRILRESRNDADVEGTPISCARTVPPGAQAYVSPMDHRPAPRPYDPWPQRQPQHDGSYHPAQAVEPVPPRRGYMAGPPQPQPHQA
jgi:hypothetical protein